MFRLFKLSTKDDWIPLGFFESLAAALKETELRGSGSWRLLGDDGAIVWTLIVDGAGVRRFERGP